MRPEVVVGSDQSPAEKIVIVSPMAFEVWEKLKRLRKHGSFYEDTRGILKESGHLSPTITEKILRELVNHAVKCRDGSWDIISGVQVVVSSFQPVSEEIHISSREESLNELNRQCKGSKVILKILHLKILFIAGELCSRLQSSCVEHRFLVNLSCQILRCLLGEAENCIEQLTKTDFLSIVRPKTESTKFRFLSMGKMIDQVNFEILLLPKDRERILLEINSRVAF